MASSEPACGRVAGPRSLGGARPGQAAPLAARISDALAVSAAAATLVFSNLGAYPLWEPDEARNALVARCVTTARGLHGWIVPSLLGRPYHDKPMLFYWLDAMALHAGGATALAARSVSAIAAIATTLVVYAWGSARWDRRAGLASALVLSTAGEFLALGRFASLDMLLTLWTSIALLALYRWLTAGGGRGAACAIGAATGLGVLTKGLVTPALVGIVGALYAGTTGRRPRRFREAGLAALVCIAVAGPWYVTAGLLDPVYMRDFFLTHHLVRFLAPTPHLHPKPAWVPPLFAIVGFLPWCALLPAVGWRLVARRERDAPQWFCVCWVIGVIGLFTLSKGKLGTYVLPALPALALLTGRYLSHAWSERWQVTTERRLALGGVATLAIGLLAAPLAVPLGTARVPELALIGRDVALGAAGAGAVLLALAIRGRVAHAIAALAVVALGTAIVAYTVAVPRVTAVLSDAALTDQVVRAIGRRRPPVVAFRAQPLSATFYHSGTIKRIESARRLEDLLVRRPDLFVITRPEYAPALLATGCLEPSRAARHVLLAPRATAAAQRDGAPPEACSVSSLKAARGALSPSAPGG